MVGAHILHKLSQVAADGIRRVVRETDDVADMRRNLGAAVGLDQLRVFLHVILALARRLQVFGVHAFHADENADTPRPARLGDEVLESSRRARLPAS